MNLVRKFGGQLKRMHRFSKASIRLGFLLMIILYIAAYFVLRAAPDSADYLYSLSVYNGLLEAAPVTLVVGVCAGFLGDLMLRGKNGPCEEEE